MRFVTGHDFSRVSMGLRRTQVDENAVECGISGLAPQPRLFWHWRSESVVVSDLECAVNPFMSTGTIFQPAARDRA